MQTDLSIAYHPTSEEKAQTTASGSGKTCPGGGIADATTCSDEDLVKDIVWAVPRKSLSDLITYHSCQGAPTVFHLRHTRILMTRVCSGIWNDREASLTFFARSSSFAVKALAQIQRSASAKQAMWSSHVTALFEESKSKVFDLEGNQVYDPDVIKLEDWEVNALLFLRGMWETNTHAGLRLEVLQVQLVRPL